MVLSSTSMSLNALIDSSLFPCVSLFLPFSYFLSLRFLDKESNVLGRMDSAHGDCFCGCHICGLFSTLVL